MRPLQYIQAEIAHLSIKELEWLLLEVEKRLAQQRHVVQLLQSYTGIAKGVWTTDAQDFVNTLRDED